MSRLGRRDTALAHLVDLALAHIYGPSTPRFVEDFRHLGRGEWDVPVGDERLTKVGSEDPLIDPDSFGEGDSPQIYNCGTSGVDTGTPAPVPMDVDDDVGLFFGIANHTSRDIRHRLFSSRGTGDTTGAHYTVSDVASAFYEDADGDGTFGPDGTTVIDDGEPHTVAHALDWGGDKARIMTDGGAVEDTESLSGRSIDASLEGTTNFHIGTTPGLINGIDPSTRVPIVAMWSGWPSEPVAAFLDALCRSGGVAPGTIKRLESFLTGHRETGWKRKPPAYLADIWDDLAYYSDHRRIIRHVGGEGVVQYSDQAGQNHAVQRQNDRRGTARGPTTRGQPLDYVEWGDGPRAFTDQISWSDDKVVFGVVRFGSDTATDRAAISISAGTNHRTAYLNVDGSSNLEVRAFDGTNNPIAEISAADVDLSGWIAVAYRSRIDYASSTVDLQIWAEDGAGIKTATASGDFTKAKTTESVGLSTRYEGSTANPANDQKIAAAHDGDLTDARIETLVSDLADRTGVT